MAFFPLRWRRARPGLAPPHSRRASRPQHLQAPRASAAGACLAYTYVVARALQLRELVVHAASRQQQPHIRSCSSRLPGEH